MIAQKMADQERSDFYVVFTMILCVLKSLEMSITMPSEVIWVSCQNLVLSEAILLDTKVKAKRIMVKTTYKSDLT